MSTDPGGTGQRVCKTGLSQTGDGSYQLPWGEDGTGKFAGKNIEVVVVEENPSASSSV